MGNISLLELTDLGVDTPNTKQYESGDKFDNTPLEIGVLGSQGLEHVQKLYTAEDKEQYIQMLQSVLGTTANIYTREIIEEDCIITVRVGKDLLEINQPLNELEHTVIQKWASKVTSAYSLLEPIVLYVSKKNDRLLVKAVS